MQLYAINMHKENGKYALYIRKYSHFLNKIWIYAGIFVILHFQKE